MDYFQIFAVIGSVVLLALIINFIRLGILKEKYSVLWIACSVAILILSVKKGILDYLAISLGVAYPPSLLFLVAFMFVLLISLHFSVVISIFHEKNKILSQEVTLLKEALREAGINVGVQGKDDK